MGWGGVGCAMTWCDMTWCSVTWPSRTRGGGTRGGGTCGGGTRGGGWWGWGGGRRLGELAEGGDGPILVIVRIPGGEGERPPRVLDCSVAERCAARVDQLKVHRWRRGRDGISQDERRRRRGCDRRRERSKGFVDEGAARCEAGRARRAWHLGPRGTPRRVRIEIGRAAHRHAVVAQAVGLVPASAARRPAIHSTCGQQDGRVDTGRPDLASTPV